MKNVDEFMDKLEQLLKRPQMFKIERIEDLEIVFITEIHLNNNILISDWLIEFNHFVISELNHNLSEFNWCQIIRLYSGSNKHSLELFIDLYHKFSKR